MNVLLPVPDPLTPEWLTAVLRASNVLRDGEVRAVEVEATGAFNSQTRRLVLDYGGLTPAGSPTRLILKQNAEHDWSKEAGKDEVMFYQLVAALPDHPPGIVPCYAAAYDQESRDSYVLLQDLSETHRPPITRDQQISIVEGVPRAEYIDSVVDTLAATHAYWWDHPLLLTDRFEVGYWTRNTERFKSYLQRRRISWDSLISGEQSWFPGDLRELYEQVLDHAIVHWKDYLQARFEARRHLTLVHGDAYFANFLSPRHPGGGPTYLLDWQSPGFDIGGYDLANLIAAYWTSQQRNEDQREQTMLRRYHSGLRTHGVSDYSWDELLTDYRTGLIFWLLMPVQDRFGGAPKDYWWPKMQCVVAAFREWHCEELLGM